MDDYADYLDGAELSDLGLDYALDQAESDRRLPADMPPNLQALIREAWAAQDRMLVGTLLPATP